MNGARYQAQGQTLVVAMASGFGLLAAAGLAFLPLKVALAACIGIAAAVVSALRLEYGLGLLFAMVIFFSDTGEGIPGRNLVMFDPDPPGLPPATVSFLLFMAGLTFLRRILLERRKSLASPWGMLAFAGIVALSWLTGKAGGWAAEDIALDATRWIFPLACWFVCVNVLDSHERIWRVLVVVFAVCAVKAVLLLAFWAAGRGFLYENYSIVSRDSAELMAFSAMVLAATALLASGRVRGLPRMVLVAGSLPMLMAVVFSFRRGHWLGLVMGLGLLWLWSDRASRMRLARMALLGVLLALPVGIMAAAYSEKGITGTVARIGERFTTIFDNRQYSNVHHRLESWVTLQDIMEQPLRGLGLGSHHSPVPSAFVQGWQEEDQPTEVVHNGFLYLWMKLGLPGLLFALWLGWRTLRRLRSFRRDMPDNPARPLIVGLSSVFGVWLLMLLTGPVFSYRHQSYLVVLFLVLIGNLLALEEHREALAGHGTAPHASESAAAPGAARTI